MSGALASCRTRRPFDLTHGRSGGKGSYYYGGSSKNGKVQGGSFDKSAVERGGFGCSGTGGG
ncbi:hypothetical protein ACFXPV_22690 [Streptomyces sp. NPDC059118]|uniref:hypothetical protein n=1 Tax=unclassified Streptomyces TaxID=2593676 RepID=UPI0036B075AA